MSCSFRKRYFGRVRHARKAANLSDTRSDGPG
jgi:hypothetical protein